MNIDNLEEPTVQVAESTAESEPKKPQEPTEPAKKAEAVKPEPKVEEPSTCASELQKYDWNQTVAYNVMLEESGGDHMVVNDNPDTGDYSIGCFQINLYGDNALTRPSETWLKVPANNVAYAYKLYQASGWNPWGATTCRYKVDCY